MSGQVLEIRRVSQNGEHIKRAYSFQIPVHHAIRVEIEKTLRNLTELRREIWVSYRRVAGVREGNVTKRVREPSGFESKY